jgi:hypothetical protein
LVYGAALWAQADDGEMADKPARHVRNYHHQDRQEQHYLLEYIASSQSLSNNEPLILAQKTASLYCTFTALIHKSFIINGAGEGNRTLVSMQP